MAALGNRLACSVQVADALAEGRPVVALESTILAHGFPRPEGRTLADELEDAVTNAGAVPATVAIIDGVLRVGLTAAELDRLTSGDEAVAKAGARDVAVYCASSGIAATTVSGTLLAARSVGIRFFATGGIGGVHRGDAGDVSADLLELSRSPVVVVSAGAKLILDLPRTLEALESLSVLVLGYGTSEFPAFTVRTSGLPLAHRVDRPSQVVDIVRAHFDLGGGGVLLCNPISAEASLDEREMAVVAEAALERARAMEISGKALTPFLLEAIAHATAGRATTANRELALANASLAAHLAVSYQRT